MTRLAVGATAPAFSLPADDGTVLTLKELRGQRVIIYFYPADDTPGCTKEACQFNELLAQFKKSQIQVIGISPDDAQAHQAFRRRYGLKFPLLTDATKQLMTKYGAYGEKQLYGKTVTGVIRSTFVIGPNGKIEHAWYAVRADGHAAKVLAELQP